MAKSYSHLQLVTVTLFGKEVLADVTKVLKGRSFWMRTTLNAGTSVLRVQKTRHTPKEHAGLAQRQRQSDDQRLESLRRMRPQNLRSQPCPHLDFALLIS